MGIAARTRTSTTSHWVYLAYTPLPNTEQRRRASSRFKVGANNTLDAASEQ